MTDERSTVLAGQSGWRAWVWAPALALLGVVVQWGFDVPHHAMVAAEPPEPSERTTTAARTAKPKPPAYKVRGAAYTKRLRNSWTKRPIGEEPIDRRFAKHHEELLRVVMRKAEAAAVPVGDPGLLSTQVECHSIRCVFELCAPTPSAPDIVAQLPKFHYGGGSLWHELREVDSEQPSNAMRTCHRYLVDFAVEGADPRKLRLVP